MKKIIYYFSGTGNSLYTAGKIAEAIGGAELISVRCNAKEVSAKDADVIGFVCPVYEWDVPGTVKAFIKELTINTNAYIFMVTTYIAVHGKSFETVEKLLEKKGTHLDYGRAVRCVASQCIAYPPFPPEKIMIPYMEKQIRRVGMEISQRKRRNYPRMSPLTRRRFHKVMGPYMAIENEYDKGFYTDDRCKGCGICVKVCPTRNITMENKHPKWNHHCHGCNACVVYCPAKAIQFKTPQAYKELDTIICRILRLPEKRKRYHHPSIKATDLMDDRKGMKRMECGINFRSPESQAEYFEAYEKTMQLFCTEVQEEYVNTEFGKSYVIKAGNKNDPPLVLLHAASCGSPIWYKNFEELSKSYSLFAIDLIGETSKSLMKKKMKNPSDNAKWLDQTIEGLGLDHVNLCGLSIGGWNAANYAARYPQKVNKLVLISPVQTFAKMYTSYFFKIMKMGFHPTRENVENYIGWGSEKEGKLPDSIITQFTLSVMNMNSNASFPKWLNERQLKSIDMPVLVLFGENEFAFDIRKAKKRARKCVQHLELEIVKDASHLIPVSKPEYINNRIVGFLKASHE